MAFEDGSRTYSDTESHVTNESLGNEPYTLKTITSNASSRANSIGRTKSNHSELSRILSGIWDDRQQDHDESEEYRYRADPDHILVSQLDLVSKNTRNDEENTPRRELDKDDEDKEEDIEGATEELEDEPPDGGYGWVIAICVMLTMFSTWGSNAGYGVFLNYYISSGKFEGASEYDYALIGGIVVFLAQGLAPFSVLAYKIFGFYTLCYAGVVIQTLGYILASFATKLWQLYLTQGVLIGISFVMIYIPPTLVLPTYFKKHRAFAFGIAVSGAGLGGLTFALSVNKLIQTTGDQKWALRMCGIVTLVVSLVAITLIKPRNYKVLPYSTTLKREFIKENCKVVFDIRVFNCYPMVLLAMWFALVVLGYMIMLFSMAAYTRLVGLSAHSGSIITALLNAGQVVGRPSLGMTGDRIGRNNLTSIACLTIAILLWGFWINATTFASIAAFSVILGLFIGIGSLMCQPLAADILDSPERLPAAWSGLNTFVLFFCLVAEVIALAIKDNNSSRPFLNTQIFTGFCFITALLLLLIIREWLVRRTFKVRLSTAKLRISKIETRKHRYLKTCDLDKSKEEDEDGTMEVLQNRVERYETLLGRSIPHFVIRMFYPIRV